MVDSIPRNELIAALKNPRLALLIEETIKRSSDLAAAQILLAAADPALPNGRALEGGDGVTLDAAVAGVLTIVVDLVVLAATLTDPIDFPVDLSAQNINTGTVTATGDVHSSADVIADDDVTAGDKVVAGVEVQTPSLRINQPAFASVATVGYTVPVNINGTIYYMCLSPTP